MKNVYLASLRSTVTGLLSTERTDLENVDVHTMINIFTECVIDAASFMYRPCVQRGQHVIQ